MEVSFGQTFRILAFILDVRNTKNPEMVKHAVEVALKARLAQR